MADQQFPASFWVEIDENGVSRLQRIPAENPDRLPQTDDSTAQFINRFTSILSGYSDRGVLASGIWRGADTGPLRAGDTVENGCALWADSCDDQPDADRAAYKAVPVRAGLILAGSIESIVITVNVTV